MSDIDEEARAIVRALAECERPLAHDRYGEPECALCGHGYYGGGYADHEPTCPYLRAREWVAKGERR